MKILMLKQQQQQQQLHESSKLLRGREQVKNQIDFWDYIIYLKT